MPCHLGKVIMVWGSGASNTLWLFVHVYGYLFMPPAFKFRPCGHHIQNGSQGKPSRHWIQAQSPYFTKRLQKLWPSSRVWFTIVVARGQTIQVHHGPMDLNRSSGHWDNFKVSLAVLCHIKSSWEPLLSVSLPVLPWLPYLHSVPRDVIKMYHVPLSWYSSLTLGGGGETVPLGHYLEEFSTMTKLKWWVNVAMTC